MAKAKQGRMVTVCFTSPSPHEILREGGDRIYVSIDSVSNSTNLSKMYFLRACSYKPFKQPYGNSAVSRNDSDYQSISQPIEPREFINAAKKIARQNNAGLDLSTLLEQGVKATEKLKKMRAIAESP